METVNFCYCVGVKAIGSEVTRIKRRADYPSVNGAWKTDSKFIGVT
mgnify:FL=1